MTALGGAALRGALSRLPEYRQLSEAVGRVRAEMAIPLPGAEAADPRESSAEVARAAVEAVLAGGEIDEELLARYVLAAAPPALPVGVLRHALLRQVLERLRPRMEALVKPHGDQLLGFLADDLQLLLAEVRRQHEGADDDQVGRYGALRVAQRAVVEEVLGQGHATTQLLGNVGLLRNMADLHPALLEELHPPRRGGPVWPEPLSPTSPWVWGEAHDLRTEPFVTWLAKDPLPAPWIPTTAELIEAGRALTDRIRAAQRAAGINPDRYAAKSVPE